MWRDLVHAGPSLVSRAGGCRPRMCLRLVSLTVALLLYFYVQHQQHYVSLITDTAGEESIMEKKSEETGTMVRDPPPDVGSNACGNVTN